MYISPVAKAGDWRDVLKQVTRYRLPTGRMAVCGDLNAMHAAWTTAKANCGGRALQALLTAVQKMQSRACPVETCSLKLQDQRNQTQACVRLLLLRSPRMESIPATKLRAGVRLSWDRIPHGDVFVTGVDAAHQPERTAGGNLQSSVVRESSSKPIGPSALRAEDNLPTL